MFFRFNLGPSAIKHTNLVSGKAKLYLGNWDKAWLAF